MDEPAQAFLQFRVGRNRMHDGIASDFTLPAMRKNVI
jgi:hypothetical protein